MYYFLQHTVCLSQEWVPAQPGPNLLMRPQTFESRQREQPHCAVVEDGGSSKGRGSVLSKRWHSSKARSQEGGRRGNAWQYTSGCTPPKGFLPPWLVSPTSVYVPAPSSRHTGTALREAGMERLLLPTEPLSPYTTFWVGTPDREKRSALEPSSIKSF